MDRFQEMQVFVRIAQCGRFSQAAEDLQIPRATVSNLIKRLEQRLGVRLLERTTRQVKMTPEGKRYYIRCLQILEDLEEADSAFQDSSPKGMLRVNLQGTLAKFFVMPAIQNFVSHYPDITLHIAEDDRLIDLVKEGVDCVLRAGHLQDSNLIAKPLTHLEQVTVASPDYLENYGVPTTLECLKHHKVVAYLSTSTGLDTALDFIIAGELKTITLASTVSVTGADLYTDAALSGLGLVQVPRYRVEKALNDGHLISILEEFLVPTMPVSVLYPQNRHISARVRVFLDWLQKRFADI
ncbi:LysR family transcriptional regulator [Marinomonas sp. 15G1-11]|uniref:LysR family transcriptional regulator n=1 Tax=Marinomonas phaeophyticola TaxID=3004091 RepID=A0ABT4JXM1_9GAMM|nr:LysR family transcriptional regulator [Marinomonas sp. 15G1-11]MCZ2722966.1 LysR family transcriptional regulator [Marinomonas sp. 15G1-11]